MAMPPFKHPPITNIDQLLDPNLKKIEYANYVESKPEAGQVHYVTILKWTPPHSLPVSAEIDTQLWSVIQLVLVAAGIEIQLNEGILPYHGA